jgi:hypothetical protein
MQFLHVTLRHGSLSDSTPTIAAAASSPSLACALNYESADGVGYRGLTALASLSMAVSGGIEPWRDQFYNEHSDTLVVAGSVERPDWGEIGLHRPFYDKEYFSNLSSEEAGSEYDKLDNVVRKYLIDMSIPTKTIDIMMSTPSDRVYIMRNESIIDAIGKRYPAYHEWVIAKCGSMPKEEERDIELVKSLLTYPKMLEIDADSAKKYFEDNAKAANKLSKGYRGYLWEKATEQAKCLLSALFHEREKIIQTLLPPRDEGLPEGFTLDE